LNFGKVELSKKQHTVNIFCQKPLSTCSFICQGTSTRRQRRDLFGHRVKHLEWNILVTLPFTTIIFWSSLSNAQRRYPKKRVKKS